MRLHDYNFKLKIWVVRKFDSISHKSRSNTNMGVQTFSLSPFPFSSQFHANGHFSVHSKFPPFLPRIRSQSNLFWWDWRRLDFFAMATATAATLLSLQKFSIFRSPCPRPCLWLCHAPTLLLPRPSLLASHRFLKVTKCHILSDGLVFKMGCGGKIWS